MILLFFLFIYFYFNLIFIYEFFFSYDKILKNNENFEKTVFILLKNWINK